MSAFLRNHWVEIDVEGQGKKAAGPRNKAGKMDITLSQDFGGKSVEVLQIICTGTDDGQITTKVYTGDGDNLLTIISYRNSDNAYVMSKTGQQVISGATFISKEDS